MKKQIIIVSGLLVFLIVAYAGISYALFTRTFNQEGENTINTLNCLDIKIDNKDRSGNASTPITLNNVFPLSDAEGLLQEPYIFTVTNKCNTPVEVNINLETLSSSTLEKNYVKYNLYNVYYKTSTTALVSSGTDVASTQIVNSGATGDILSQITLKPNMANNVETDTPSAGASATFELRLWLNEATTLAQAKGKKYDAKITASATAIPMTFYTPEFNASEGTLLYALKNGDYTYTDPITVPGQEISKVYENVIAKTQDDYGTSYYFRGTAPNNYVMFAGRCWRIVRIDGNSNIKLWLWNDSDSCEEHNVATGSFNNSYSRNGYIGLMYGNVNSSEFSTGDEKNPGVHDNINDSTMLTSLKTWYKTVFGVSNASPTSAYTELLADVIWCNDKKLTGGTGIGTAISNYGFDGRKTSPSLVCQDAIENDVNNISRFTANTGDDPVNNAKGNGKLKDLISGNNYLYYKIGLVTADEVTFAGGRSGSNNTNYFMYTGDNYWTLSPYTFNGYANVWAVLPTGNISSFGHVLNSAGFRPAVSLKSVAAISGGSGTSSDPYIISV